MASLKERDRRVIWHPYTQMLERPDSIGIVRGEKEYLFDEHGKRYIDAISSWWVNLHGHSHPYIAQKIAGQAAKLEHCMFAGFTHEPAVELAEKLLAILPPNQARVFYSDNGSTAVEVALKMAIQYWKNKKDVKRKRIIALENAYHGDTFAAMSVSGRGLFTRAFDELMFDVAFVPFSGTHDFTGSLSWLEQKLEKEDVAALIAEPLIQGASGMLMYEPDLLEQLFRLCKKYGTLIIADEVFTGFGRTGKMFAVDHVNISPDMICLSKGITGGSLPLGVTACSQEIYEAFLSRDPGNTLYHGHSYTANPLACAAACASMELLTGEECRDNISRISEKQLQFIRSIRTNEKVIDARCRGTVMAVTIRTNAATSYINESRNRIYESLLQKNIIMRPLGNIIYMVPPYCISDENLDYVHRSIAEILDEQF